MTLPSLEERTRILNLFASGVAELERAVADAPEKWVDVRPEPKEWSIREIVAHCADMELMSSARCRMLIAEPESLIIGIDPDAWAASPGYRHVEVAESMALVRASRHFMMQLLTQLTDQQWAIVGRHSESEDFPLANWLTYFANHLHVHAEQIRKNVHLLETPNIAEPE